MQGSFFPYSIMIEAFSEFFANLGDNLLLLVKLLPVLLKGSGITVVVVAGAMLFGLTFGLPLSVVQVYGPKPLRWLVSIYVWFFRGTPILVLLYLIFFGLFWMLNFHFNEILAVILIMGMTSTAYQSQIFRGSLQSIPAGQLKGARSLGMSDFQAIRSIILPQALRISIPGWSNEYSIILKDSALAYAVGCKEIMSYAKGLAIANGNLALAIYILAGIIYLIITIIGLWGLRRLQRKIRIPGYSHA